MDTLRQQRDEALGEDPDEGEDDEDGRSLWFHTQAYSLIGVYGTWDNLTL